MTNIHEVEKVLREFEWHNYGMDDVSYRLEADADSQEWLPDLAKKIIEALSVPTTMVDPMPHTPQRFILNPGHSIEGSSIQTFDMLRQVFGSQAHFQKLLGHDYSTMSTEELVEYIKNQVLALLDEGHEALNEVSWKPWAKDTFVNHKELAGELADILCFLVNLALAVGMTAQDLYAAHQEKALRNIKRQEVGYSQREGKCPGCLRAIDDLVAKGIPIGNFGGVDYCSIECIEKTHMHLVKGTGIPFYDTTQES